MIKEINGDTLQKIQNPKPTTRCQDCGIVIPNDYTDNEQFCPLCLDMCRKKARSDHAANDRRQARLI